MSRSLRSRKRVCPFCGEMGIRLIETRKTPGGSLLQNYECENCGKHPQWLRGKPLVKFYTDGCRLYARGEP